jgi:hypothetical protein
MASIGNQIVSMCGAQQERARLFDSTRERDDTDTPEALLGRAIRNLGTAFTHLSLGNTEKAIEGIVDAANLEALAYTELKNRERGGAHGTPA